MINLSNKNIIHVKKENQEFLQFKKLLKYGIQHAYTLKGENLDFSHHVPDEKSSYLRLAKALEIPEDTFVKPIQTHKSQVQCISQVQESGELQDVDYLNHQKR